jgi:hypothetical protein
MSTLAFRIINRSSADLILVEKSVKGLGFANVGTGSPMWINEPPGKIPAKSGDFSYAAKNDGIGHQIIISDKYEASVDGFVFSITFSGRASQWPRSDSGQEAELSKKDILNVREQGPAGHGDRIVIWTITDYPD